MNLVTYFIIALILSFLGSLPIGLISLSIVQRTLEKGRQAGLMIALGATIMEFVYTYLALISLDLFAENNEIGNYIKIIATFVFFILAFYYLLKKNAPKIQASTSYDYFDFLRGFIVGMMNLLIVPFWIFLGIWLKTYGYTFVQQDELIFFSLGAALGALLAFILYVWGSEMVMKKTDSINQYTNKIVGFIFLGLGIFQLVSQLSN